MYLSVFLEEARLRTVPVNHEPRNPGSLELISTWEPGCRCGGSSADVAGAFRLGGIPGIEI